MKNLLLSAAAVTVGATLLSPGASAAALQHRVPLKAIFTTLPARNVDMRALLRQPSASQTIPFFSSSVQSPLDGNTYGFQIVGTDPTKSKVSTTVKYVPLLLRVHFADGTVLDPTQPGCNDTVPVSKRFYGSPLFHNTALVSNGVNVGTTQIIDGFQRAEFWNYVQGSNYHVLLARTAAPRVVDVNAPLGSITQPGACSGSNHNLGEIDISMYDSLIQQINNKYATTTQIPIAAAYNVVQTQGTCCIIGYHSAYGRAGGTQVYSVGAYTDAGEFGGGVADIHAWTHELGELFNDPFVNNSTPAWGNIGQVVGCQSNLEVGDPLTGTAFLVNYNGFTYHPQELAYFDWFYRTPSKGTGGKYSFEGTFTSAQGACTG